MVILNLFLAVLCLGLSVIQWRRYKRLRGSLYLWSAATLSLVTVALAALAAYFQFIFKLTF